MVVTTDRKRLVSIMAGALLVLLAALGYHSYSEISNGDAASVASVPRIQISDFKLMHDRAAGFGTLQMATRDPGQQGGEDTLYIIDVRSQALYSEGHIRGALSIPEAELEARITSVVAPSRSDALIVLYCA